MKLGIVIVESRKIDLVAVLNSHLKHLPHPTNSFIYSSLGIADSYKVGLDLFPQELKDEKRSTSTFVFITPNFSVDDYNKLLTSVSFWKSLSDHDRILVIQHDSMLLRSGIEEFYSYDYVGAPWKFQQHGGNGGLSLRNPKVMLEICEKFSWSSNQGNEDVWFCNIMHNHKIGNLAPRYVAEKFSCESIFKLETLGYHAINKWLTPAECDQIKTQYNGNNTSN